MTREHAFDNDPQVSIKMSPTHAGLLNAPISTERLVIEPIVSAHAISLFELMQNEAIYEWISAKPPKTVEHLAQWWTERESRLGPEGTEAWLNWAVRRSADGAYVGKLDAVVDDANIATNVGYLFFPPYWGQGYASESVLAMADHLAACGVLKMFATVTLGNVASYRVLERAGFNRSRVIPNNDTIRGVMYDDVEYVRVVKKP